MIGDRMDTDIVIGSSGMETILVLSGVTRREEVCRYPTSHTRVESVAEMERLNLYQGNVTHELA
jgi:NagD protein